jgi:hypothetical protein
MALPSPRDPTRLSRPSGSDGHARILAEQHPPGRDPAQNPSHFSLSLAALLSTVSHESNLTAADLMAESGGATVSPLIGACVRP